MCGAVAIGFFMSLAGQIEGMQRVVVPGEKTFQLLPGDYIVFGESESKVAGTTYRADTFSVACTLTDQSGRAVQLQSVGRTHTKYSLGDYSGGSLFELTIPAEGRYTLACTGDQQTKAVLAIGQGIGKSIVTSVLMLLAGLISSGIAVLMLFLRRRKAYAILKAREAAAKTT
jgi:hypothetical protein